MNIKDKLEKKLRMLNGYLTIRLAYEIKYNKKFGLMDTTEDKECLGHRNEINDISFAYSFEHLREQILEMQNDEKKILVAMPVECTDRNYKLYKYIDPEDMYLFLEKKDDKTKGTINKKSIRLLIDKYEKRNNI